MKKRIASIITAVMMILTMIPAMPAYAGTAAAPDGVTASGTYGDLKWELDADGLLTISGNGEMMDDTWGGYPWFDYKDRITSLKIEEGVTSIGTGAFYECSGITGDLVIPDSVKTIGSHAFCSCSGLDGTLTLPKGLTGIDFYAFAYCRGLTGELVIPKTVEYIGYGAFSHCSNFTGELVLPDGLKEIGKAVAEDGAFQDCSGFTGELVIPESLTKIGGRAFQGCTGLTGTLTIPDSVTVIENFAFADCSGFTGELVLPTSVKAIEYRAFENCTGLNGDLVIPNSVKTIESYAFYNCTGMNGNLVIPNSVKSIEEYTYTNCMFKNIYIPDSVTSILYNAFDQYSYSARVFHMFKKSYADKEKNLYIHNNEPVKYITEEEPGQKDYLQFRTATLVVGATDTSENLDLASQIVSNKSFALSDKAVTIEDEDLAMYSNGYVVGLYEGTCDITVTVGEQSCTATLFVVNEEIKDTTSFSFVKNFVLMDRGTTAYNQIIKGSPISELTGVKWYSSNEDVVTVDEKGNITAVSTGTATITAKSGKATASYDVTVGNVCIGLYALYDSDKHTMAKGTKESVRYYIYPFDTTDEAAVTFESSNSKVVTITDEGMMEAHAVGSADITIRKGEYEDVVTVTVNNPIKGISLDKTAVRAYEQDELQLTVYYDPADHNEEVTPVWKSSDEAIAVVDKKGLVTITGVGIAEITATVKEFTAKCEVTARPMVPLESIALDAESKTIKYNDEFTFTVTKTPKNTTNKKPVIWTSSDDKVVTVAEDGTIKGIGIGTATVTATVKDTKDADGKPITASCEITVEKAVPEYDIPELVPVLVGKTLADIELPDGFAWDDPATDVGNRGEKVFKASYTPEDIDKYQIVNDIEIPVRVIDPKVTAISVQESLELCVDGKAMLKPEIKTQDNPKYSVEWSVEDSEIATVDDNGNVIAKSAGETIVIVKTSEDMTASCMVTVKEHVAGPVPTCTTEQKCTVCDAKLADALKHDLESHDAKEPTCTEKGWDAYEECQRAGCDYTTYEEIAAKNHTPGLAATCTTAQSCIVCGEKLAEALNHLFSGYVVNDDATCQQGPTETAECDRCGKTDTRQSEAGPANHRYGEWEVVEEPTATEDGKQERYCIWCDDVQTEKINAVGTSIIINEENFPDAEFRRALRENWIQDTEGDNNVLTPAELEDLTSFYNNFDEYAIKDLTGIHLLRNLNYLDIAYSKLIKHIPLLPDSVTEIRCDETSVVSFEKLPASLERLAVQGGAMTKLPELPAGLEDLWISQNRLSSLPELPASLKTLSCWDNQLKELPELPAGVEELNCDGNQLKALPALPAGLKELSCTENELKSLADLPDTVVWFRCSDNQLTKLPALPKYLTELYAARNQLTGILDVSGLEYLSVLSASDNLLTAVKLCEEAPYTEILLSGNAMKSLGNISGAVNIPWDTDYNFQFEGQSNCCKVYGHAWNEGYYSAPTCTSSGMRRYDCANCWESQYNTLQATGHKYGALTVTQKATFGVAGNRTRYCTTCKAKETKNYPFAAVAAPKLAATSYTFNNKTKTPKLSIPGMPSSYYTVSYAKGRKNVGTYSVTVTFKTNAYYYGSKTVQFQINPAKPSSVKLSKGKKQFKVSWKKPTKTYRNQIDGYQVRYATSKSKLAKATPKKFSGKTLTNKTIKKLKAKKKYYVQVRTYNKIGKTTYYSAWTTAKSVKTK